MDAKLRDRFIRDFAVALGKGLGDPLLNVGAYRKHREDCEAAIRLDFERRGLRLPRLFWEAAMREALPVGPPRDAEAFLNLLIGVTTPIDQWVMEHVADRDRDGGNNVWEVYGYSGTGKSSGIMGLVHRLAPFKPGSVVQRVAFDGAAVPDMFATMQPGEWGVLDEQTYKSGQGSQAAEEELLNLEEQGRASKKSLVKISPAEREGESQRVVLRSWAWSRETQSVVFLVRVGGHWLGHLLLPFAPKEIWDEYSPLKKVQVEKATTARLRNKNMITLLANRAARDPEFEAVLLGRGKPRAADFKMAVANSLERLVDSRTEQDVVKRAEFLAKNWDVQKERFEERFGEPPATSWARVAKKYARS